VATHTRTVAVMSMNITTPSLRLRRLLLTRPIKRKGLPLRQ
jgi:hypothetical protein